MNTSVNRSVRQRGTREGLDEVNEQLLRASWELDFLARAASADEALPAPEQTAPESS